MNLSSDQLDDLTFQVAKDQYPKAIFRRRRLMLHVESRIKEIGAWTPEDDILSESADPKSKGLANIDWSISRLRKCGRLVKVGDDKWRLA